MKLSPLQMLHSQLTGFSIVARSVDPDELMAGTDLYPTISGEHIESKVELGKPDGQEETNQFAVKVGIHSVKELPSDFPYRFAVQIEGIFRIDHDGDLQERERLVVINGASMLLGIVREQLLMLTLRHKNGPLLLPSLDLRGLGPATRKAPTAAAAEPTKPKPRKRKSAAPGN